MSVLPHEQPAATPLSPTNPQKVLKDLQKIEQLGPGVHKCIVVCCDGTWENGLTEVSPAAATNVVRLSRAVKYVDERADHPIPQIVYYQTGVASEGNLYSKDSDGVHVLEKSTILGGLETFGNDIERGFSSVASGMNALTGSSLIGKVEEAYCFIANNYDPGDEIFLFGFSRGAYTARMVAMFIGEIGVLNRQSMENFLDIFRNYQKLRKSEDSEEKKRIEGELAQWRGLDAKGRIRAGSDEKGKFTIKCLGVWDTVGSVGNPWEWRESDDNVFGFPDRQLGEHVQSAYQALALDEMRLGFVSGW